MPIFLFTGTIPLGIASHVLERLQRVQLMTVAPPLC